MKVSGTTIATYTGGTATSDLVVTFNSSATLSNVQSLFSSIAFKTVNSTTGGQRVLQLTATDGQGGTSNTVSRTVDVTTNNNPPVLDVNPSPALDSINEDATNPPGTLVSTLLTGVVTDPDPSAAKGIAVTSTSAWGTWQFSLDSGSTWSDVGTVTDNSARLLPATANIRFLPAANTSGNASISYRAWDQTQGTAGSLFDAFANRGGIGSTSLATESASLQVTPVNDSPVFSNLPGTPIEYVPAVRDGHDFRC